MNSIKRGAHFIQTTNGMCQNIAHKVVSEEMRKPWSHKAWQRAVLEEQKQMGLSTLYN